MDLMLHFTPRKTGRQKSIQTGITTGAVALATALTLAALGTSSTAQAETAWISDRLTVPLRSGPSNANRILHRGLPSGTRMEVLARDSDSGFVQIRTDRGTEGWLPEQYLVSEPIARDRLVAANTPLAMIAVGTFIRPRATYGAPVAQFILIRMVLGTAMGYLIALAMGMSGLDLVTCCVAPALPAGTTSLIYAGNEGLDTEFAASLISATVIVGAVLVNVLPHMLASIYL